MLSVFDFVAIIDIVITFDIYSDCASVVTSKLLKIIVKF